MSLRVLLSAYSCQPGAGSEPGVGFETVRAVADHHQTWVITREKNVEPLLQYFESNPPAGSIEVIGLDLGDRAMRLKKRLGSLGVYWYYDRWQRAATETMDHLSGDIDFDLTHHVTFATDWARAGVATTKRPFVWGPVGGGSKNPWRLVPALGTRGMLSELARVTGRWAMRRRQWYRRAWKASDATIVQNPETASLAPAGMPVRIHPNSTSLLTPAVGGSGERSGEILVVGRLIPWKGGALALRALEKMTNTEAVLQFIGQGPDLKRLTQIAAKLGLTDRVTFAGAIPRDEVLARMARAGALLHPAMHDESPITVGESLSLGTPVVCLDHGGPAELLRWWPDSPGRAVPVQSVDQTAAALAAGLDHFIDVDFPILETPKRPFPGYADSILAIYDEVTTQRSI